MTLARAARAIVVAFVPACSTLPPAERAGEPRAGAPRDAAPAAEAVTSAEPPAPPAPPGAAPPESRTIEAPCVDDAACGFEPAADRCVADPRANRQPAVLDQGIVCWCDAGRCATLRVQPVPCESDAACAVEPEPRPHPVATDAAHPHGPKNPCRGAHRAIVHSAVCEQTNLCTLRRHACGAR